MTIRFDGLNLHEDLFCVFLSDEMSETESQINNEELYSHKRGSCKIEGPNLFN